MGGPAKTITFRGDTSGLEVDLDTALDRVNKKAGSLFARLPKDIQKGLIEAQAKTVEAIKGAVVQSVASAGLAISGPARTTFDQALRAANDFRKETSKISVASGKDFGTVEAQVKLVSRVIGEMPDRTMSWARSIRKLTGDWDGALDALVVAKDRALQLDEPIDAITDSMRILQGAFGFSTERMTRFFGTMDAQARHAGVTVERMHRQWGAFGGAFARMSSKGAEGFAGITAAFAASSKDPDQAIRNQAYGMGVINSGARLVEMRMRRKGLLKKGEYLTDPKTGELDDEKMGKALVFTAKDMERFHGSRARAIEVQAGEDMGARRDVAGFFSAADILSKGGKLKDLPPEERKAFERYSGMPAGARDRADVQKHIRDIGAGDAMLGAQDAAVAAGGGAAGLAMEAATGVFGQAVDRFGNAVMTFVGRGAPMAAGAGSAAAGAGGAAAGTAAAGAGRAALGGLGLRALGVGGALLTLGGEQYTSAEMANAYASETMTATPGGGVLSSGGATEYGDYAGMPREVSLSPAAARAQGEAQAQALANRVIKVQVVPSYGPPEPEQAAK